MIGAKDFISKQKTKFDIIFLINLFFCTFPLSFILGSLIINLNLLVFCCLGILYLKKQLFYFDLDFFLKVVSLFFLTVVLSSLVISIKSVLIDGYENTSFNSLTKSILFLRFLLLIIVVYTLNHSNILNFKYFFYSASFLCILLSLDLIHQYFFGYDILGLESEVLGKNSGFFGSELIAGGYIQRFSFFSIFLVFYLTMNSKWKNFIMTSLIVFILSLGIAVSGNRMPAVLSIIGLILILFFNTRIRKNIIFGFVIFLISLIFLSSYNESIKTNYLSFVKNSKNILVYSSKKIFGYSADESSLEKVKKEEEDYLKGERGFVIGSGHMPLFLTAIDTWKINKILGGGIKSFRVDCSKITGYRFCSNHPHNYYLEILTESGLVGFSLIILILLILLKFAFICALRLKDKTGKDNFILFAALVTLLVELFPLRSSGSFFSTPNATFIALILSMVITYKKKSTT